MRRVKIVINGQIFTSHALIAETFEERIKGLIGKEKPAFDECLIIPWCNCIHTAFMKFPLDLFFLDKHNTVLKEFFNVKPWRIVYAGIKIRTVIEFASYPERKSLLGQKLIFISL